MPNNHGLKHINLQSFNMNQDKTSFAIRKDVSRSLAVFSLDALVNKIFLLSET